MAGTVWKLALGKRGSRTFSLSADRDRMSAEVECIGQSGARNARVTIVIRHVANRAYARAEANRLIANLWDVVADHQTEHAKDPEANSSADVDHATILDSRQDTKAVIVDIVGDDAIWIACSHFGDDLMNEVV